MGRVGAGKSTVIILHYSGLHHSLTAGSQFIRIAAGSDKIDDGLNSLTTQIKVTRIGNPLQGGEIHLVDTPGFDGTMTDTDSIRTLIDWLEKV
jgi:hypothetical protein